MLVNVTWALGWKLLVLVDVTWALGWALCGACGCNMRLCPAVFVLSMTVDGCYWDGGSLQWMLGDSRL